MVESINAIDHGTLGMLGGFALGGAFITFLIIATILEHRQKISKTVEREQSRREIAAYVAEGSISPEDATKLLVDDRKTLASFFKEG